MTGTKVQKSFQTITPFAGISFINEEFSRCGYSKFFSAEQQSVMAKHLRKLVNGQQMQEL